MNKDVRNIGLIILLFFFSSFTAKKTVQVIKDEPNSDDVKSDFNDDVQSQSNYDEYSERAFENNIPRC